MFEDDLNPAENGNKSAKPGLGRWSVQQYIYSNEKSMFLIVSNSFDENVEITYIYIAS
jgi:hypothetical protein